MPADPRYTSQTSPKCGHTEKAKRNKKTQSFCCQTCHYTSNDDRTGAMNLQRQGMEYILEETPEHDSGKWVAVSLPRCDTTLKLEVKRPFVL